MSEKNTNVTETVEIDPGMSVMPEGPGPMDVPTVIPELDSMLAAMSSALPAYQTTAWKNKPSTETPIDAAAMTRIEQRLVDLTNAVNGLRDSVSRYHTLWGTTLTIPVNKNQLGILLCSAHIGAIMVSGKNVYIDKSLGVTVSVSVSGDNATLSVDTEMSLTALMMTN